MCKHTDQHCPLKWNGLEHGGTPFISGKKSIGNKLMKDAVKKNNIFTILNISILFIKKCMHD
jgi:hypothetical protein